MDIIKAAVAVVLIVYLFPYILAVWYYVAVAVMVILMCSGNSFIYKQ